MTNKINGIDVSKCVHLDEWKHCNICEELIKTIPDRHQCVIEKDLRCECYSDCYFKQLKRLQEENEKLKKKKDEYYLINLDYEAKISYLIQALEKIRDRIIHPDGLPEDYTLKRYILEECNEVLNDRD